LRIDSVTRPSACNRAHDSAAATDMLGDSPEHRRHTRSALAGALPAPRASLEAHTPTTFVSGRTATSVDGSLTAEALFSSHSPPERELEMAGAAEVVRVLVRVGAGESVAACVDTFALREAIDTRSELREFETRVRHTAACGADANRSRVAELRTVAIEDLTQYLGSRRSRRRPPLAAVHRRRLERCEERRRRCRVSEAQQFHTRIRVRPTRFG
jgi:hypothetical protein